MLANGLAHGTMARQDADSVAITGGAIDGTIIGGTTAADGTFDEIVARKIDVNTDTFESIIVRRDSGNTQVSAEVYSDTATHTPRFAANRARGTEGSEAVVQSGDTIANYTFGGWTGSAFTTTAGFQAIAKATFSGSEYSSSFGFFITDTTTRYTLQLQPGGTAVQFVPTTNGAVDLGSTALRYENIYQEGELIQYNSAAPSGISGAAQLVTLSGEMWAYDSGGTGTQLTSHPDERDAMFDTTGRPTNYIIRDRIQDTETQVDVVGMALALEAITGLPILGLSQKEFVRSKSLRRSQYQPRTRRRREQRRNRRQTTRQKLTNSIQRII